MMYKTYIKWILPIIAFIIVIFSAYMYISTQVRPPENPSIVKSYDTTGEIWVIYLKINRSDVYDYIGIEEVYFDGRKMWGTSSVLPSDGHFAFFISSLHEDYAIIQLKVNPWGDLKSGVHKIEFTTHAGDFITIYVEANTKKMYT